MTHRPVVDMLLDGKKIGTFSAARRQISIKGMDLCPDASCAAMGNMHKMGCKGKELKAQRQKAREFAKCKNFDKVLGANRAQAQALRIGFKQAAMAKKMLFCKMFNAKAVPCQGECMAYPCCEWPEIMETELDGTFYTELPAFRWPKRTSKPGIPGQGRQGEARAAARRGQRHHRRGDVRSCCEQGGWCGALVRRHFKSLVRRHFKTLVRRHFKSSK